MGRRGGPSARVALPLLLGALLGAGCLLGTPGGPAGGGNGAKVIPVATAIGAPIGAPVTAVIDAAGGPLASAGGEVLLTVPAGSVAGPTTFTLTPISSWAAGAVGTSYRIEADQPLSGTVDVTWRGLGAGYQPGLDVTSLTIRTQDAGGFWVAPGTLAWNVGADTVTATTTHLSDWALVFAGTPDLAGPFTLVQSVGIPFAATGSATLYAWGGGIEPTYWVTGTIDIPATLTAGTATCVPDATSKNLDLSVAEVHGAVFRWGINARWRLTCTDGGTGAVTTVDLATQFDTMRINLPRCPAQYVGTQVNGAAFVQGAYAINCTDGSVTSGWDFRSCTPGGTCLPADSCASAGGTGTVSCSNGVGTCVPSGPPAADGAACASPSVPAGTCSGGVCR